MHPKLEQQLPLLLLQQQPQPEERFLQGYMVGEVSTK
jgi:hypothetical protein